MQRTTHTLNFMQIENLDILKINFEIQKIPKITKKRHFLKEMVKGMSPNLFGQKRLFLYNVKDYLHTEFHADLEFRNF